MIILFLLDMLMSSVFLIPTNFIISFIPYVRYYNFVPYILITIFINIYYIGFNIIGLMFIFIIFLMNKTIFSHKNLLLVNLLNYFIYYLAFGFIYNSLNLKSFTKSYLIACLFVIIIYHILPKFNIKLFRWSYERYYFF